MRGLLRPAWEDYLAYLKLSLSWPDHAIRKSESWREHLGRLRRHAAVADAEYTVAFQGVDTADYGTPQRRHRAIAMGIRTDIAVDWNFPRPTHSREALVWEKHVSEGYWKRHGIVRHLRVSATGVEIGIADRLRRMVGPPAERPWLTVRDAISNLPSPTEDDEPIADHRLRPGARVYARHTGSRWDQPAKALKAGHHGVPGGENILALPDGSVRYFTLREMARLQGFPDEYVFGEGWKRPIRLLGNAVPVQVGEAFGKKIATILRQSKTKPMRPAA